MCIPYPGHIWSTETIKVLRILISLINVYLIPSPGQKIRVLHTIDKKIKTVITESVGKHIFSTYSSQSKELMN